MYKAPHDAIFPTILERFHPALKYSSQHPVLKGVVTSFFGTCSIHSFLIMHFRRPNFAQLYNNN